ncbi:MAG TPA: hypothetical protein VN654_28585 [Vicinamibacterales bacterium]|jgi:hypothetical protein|nr:hypothetical protein [Vicinamibacterales bacterium]
MSSDPLPPDVATFIGDHFRSIDEIEVLTAIIDAPDRWWDARLVYGELGIPVASARALLDRLAALNLLDIRFTDEVRYRFRPGTGELARTAARLVAAYRSNHAAVVRACAAAPRGVRDFADAFRIRRNGNR